MHTGPRFDSRDSDARRNVRGGERWSAQNASVARRLSGGGSEFAFDSLAIRGSSEERPAAARRTVVRLDDILLPVASQRPVRCDLPTPGCLSVRAGSAPSIYSGQDARPCQDCSCANYHDAFRAAVARRPGLALAQYPCSNTNSISDSNVFQCREVHNSVVGQFEPGH